MVHLGQLDDVAHTKGLGNGLTWCGSSRKHRNPPKSELEGRGNAYKIIDSTATGSAVGERAGLLQGTFIYRL